MNKFKSFAVNLRKILDEEDIKIDEPMKYHTSFKVGGPVDILITPRNFQQVVDVIKLCGGKKIPFYIMGNGSNLLVKDGGIRGIIIKLIKLNHIKVEGNRITAGSGTSLKDISAAALNNSLTGLEFACGIPGSVGGAVTMNAGAYNGEISNVIESAKVVDNCGDVRILNKEELKLGYRMSSILMYGYTILEVAFNLEKGEYQKIENRIDDLNRRRSEKQPLEYASAGSTFKRPAGHFAAKLIEDSGLKGESVGDAQVSEKHSGFIINRGNATASDILNLIKVVQDRVKEKFNVDLYTEVRIIGED
ncbi:UDP-N-acetylmuramate dehydrogenase [Clostridium luticellarii]|jgi:UDP-N-acetylmuramate dehydrogenase|uniref:UDP-N-acetylenolpyruvoylglucosamine reductase n=1 Tax=Clostridium luticellarii TaxID=1691940 RepID=A0A2T0BR40_9CLOT|nr:UDP-N-acetylmuramate dehydrogenase [Clostridium luticellarii]MCI1944516.1 UDP-N-acetylmuramate dehydrogenase [Clostridium luticellarii]MCI1968015.1 UDP-N-acetylmuramate dehydrogenase [Clostridium luticellarii]MCI1995593.1 UDP-N-acetylmuramate dehydrogenase [Clostridium luticellarii]MCI2039927.1 UDP-N-acetylmuramate dehydrogenase [Clostridium luticellarii]PRR86339.1 UDP-N-acetylenolpyruvoylglucosamine reductase [Clostridium luticellarii]